MGVIATESRRQTRRIAGIQYCCAPSPAQKVGDGLQFIEWVGQADTVHRVGEIQGEIPSDKPIYDARFSWHM